MSKSFTNAEVTKAWTEKVGRPVKFELLEVEAFDGRKQTQLINADVAQQSGGAGGVVVAVNQTGEAAIKTLVENAGVPFLDGQFGTDDIDGPGEVVEVDTKKDRKLADEKARKTQVSKKAKREPSTPAENVNGVDSTVSTDGNSNSRAKAGGAKTNG